MSDLKRNIPDILVKIVETKKEEIKALFPHKVDMKVRCMDIQDAYPLLKALKPENGSKTIISEVKKASPSAGIIADDFNPVNIALDYERGGADCISVLTDINYFKGHPDYLSRITKNVKIPVLRKDFIICEEQIYEARCLGASSFLLIATILETNQMIEFIELGRNLGMEPLVEIHDEYELGKALSAKSKIVGINNRNLRNFTVDINTTVNLIPQIPGDIVIVGESGITTVEVAKNLYESGCDSLLIGEFLMRSKDKSKLVKKIKE
jgi:indole-3-glycerol phosphate synthase